MDIDGAWRLWRTGVFDAGCCGSGSIRRLWDAYVTDGGKLGCVDTPLQARQLTTRDMTPCPSRVVTHSASTVWLPTGCAGRLHAAAGDRGET